MNPSRILFVEQFYYPEGWGGAELPRDLTIHLASREYSVEVICGSDQYVPVDGDPGIDPQNFGVRINRIAALIGGDIHRAKLLRQLWFYVLLVPRLLMCRSPDIFIAQTNPPLAIVLVSAVARIRRRPLIIIAMDIYPEVIAAHGALRSSGIAYRILRAILRWTYLSARRIVALGPVMAAMLESKGVSRARIIEISNWATGALGIERGSGNRLADEWNLRGKFIILYSGNLGVGHEFETLLEGVALVRQDLPLLRVVIVGKGSRLGEVTRRVKELELEEVFHFSGPLPADKLPQSLGLAQLALVTMQPNFAGLIVPSKLQGYMARGIPVLYIGPRSDVSIVVERAACGIAIANGDGRGVADAILGLHARPDSLDELGVNGKRYYDQHISCEFGLAKYEATIHDALMGSTY